MTWYIYIYTLFLVYRPYSFNTYPHLIAPPHTHTHIKINVSSSKSRTRTGTRPCGLQLISLRGREREGPINIGLKELKAAKMHADGAMSLKSKVYIIRTYSVLNRSSYRDPHQSVLTFSFQQLFELESICFLCYKACLYMVEIWIRCLVITHEIYVS